MGTLEIILGGLNRMLKLWRCLECVLVHVCCYWRTPQTGWFINKRSVLLRVWKLESWKVKVLMDLCLVRATLCSRCDALMLYLVEGEMLWRLMAEGMEGLGCSFQSGALMKALVFLLALPLPQDFITFQDPSLPILALGWSFKVSLGEDIILQTTAHIMLCLSEIFLLMTLFPSCST